MKNSNRKLRNSFSSTLFILASVLLLSSCNSSPTESSSDTSESEAVTKFENIYWNVRSIRPDGQALDIKAFDESGNSYDIKAIQNSDQDSFLDVKAFVDGKELPVKVLVSEDRFAPVKAIAPGGKTFDVKAVTPEGKTLEVKGVSRVGAIVIMRTISEEGDYYGVKAISPGGILDDIKGIKINTQEREMTFQGLSVYAHVKAMHPSADEKDFPMPPKKAVRNVKQPTFKIINWNLKAITPEGVNLDIKAIDPEGNTFDIKAIQDSEQHSFMSINALVDGYEIPCRVMEMSGEYAPVKALGPDGTTYEIKAVTESGETLGINGISRSGNIVHVKAVTGSGELYGVKAISPDGKLNDVKGIKIMEGEVEMISQGQNVYAHLRAISQ